MVGKDVEGQARWQWGSLKRMQTLLLFKKHKRVFAFQACPKALGADCMQSSGCWTDALKKQPWSGEDQRAFSRGLGI